jgi:hypothetical protein
MAYGNVFVGEVLLDGVTYYFELAKEGYTGAVDGNMQFGDPAIQPDFDQTDNPFEPHKKHRLKVMIQATAAINLDTFEFIKKTTWRGSLYTSYGTGTEQLLYRGYLIPFEMEETVKRYELNPIMELTLTDGINFLKAKNYGIPPAPTVKISLKDLIAKALKQTGHELPFEIYDNGFEEFMNDGATDCPLAQTFVDTFTYTDESDKPFNYYDVLIDILGSRNLSLKQHKGVWQIVAVHEATGGSVAGRAYSVEGVYTGAVTLNTDSGSVGLAGTVKWTDWGVRRILEPLGKQLVQIDYRPLNLLKNGSFLHFDSGSPIFWNFEGTYFSGDTQQIVGGGVKVNRLRGDTSVAYPNIDDGRKIVGDVVEIDPISNFTFSAQVTSYNFNVCYVEIKAFADGREAEGGDVASTGVRYLDPQGRWRDRRVVWQGEFSDEVSSIGDDVLGSDRALSGDNTISLYGESYYDQESIYRLPFNHTNLRVTIFIEGRQNQDIPDAYIIWQNMRLTQVPFDVAEIRREQWEIRNTNEEFSFEESPIETTLFDSNYTGLKGRTFLSNGQTADGWLLPNSGGDRSQLYDQILRARMRLLSRFVRLYEGEVRATGDNWLTPGDVVTMSEEAAGGTLKALILHVGSFDIKRRIGDVVLMELGTDDPDIILEKIWQRADGTEIELLKFDTVPTNSENTGGIDEIDIEYEGDNITEDSPLTKLKLGGLKTDVVVIGRTGSLVDIIGDTRLRTGEIFLVAEGNPEAGLKYTDEVGNVTGYVKQVTGGTAIKAIDSDYHVVIDTSGLTQDVKLTIPNLAVNSVIATANGLTTNYLPKLGANGVLVNSIISEDDFRVGVGFDNPVFTFDVRQVSPYTYNRASFGGMSPDGSSHAYMLIPPNGGGFFDVIRRNNTALRIATETSLGFGFSTQMTLTADGKLGVKTPDPTHDFHVNGTTRTNKLLVNTATDSGEVAQFNGTTRTTNLKINGWYSLAMYERRR